jgi:hypothetical protein
MAVLKAVSACRLPPAQVGGVHRRSGVVSHAGSRFLADQTSVSFTLVVRGVAGVAAVSGEFL